MLVVIFGALGYWYISAVQQRHVPGWDVWFWFGLGFFNFIFLELENASVSFK